MAFTPLGGLARLPDEVRWAGVVAHLPGPGGAFVVADPHSIGHVIVELAPDEPGVPRSRSPAFSEEARTADGPGSYADLDVDVTHTEGRARGPATAGAS